MVVVAVERNRSPSQEQGIFENCRPKQDSRVRIPAGQSKFSRVANHLGRHWALSCYSAKQAFEARQQAIRCSISGFSNLRTGDNGFRIAQVMVLLLARPKGCSDDAIIGGKLAQADAGQ
jgi:hypothetical protein